MPNVFLCVGGMHDGTFLTREEFREIEDSYERMPIFAPHAGTNGFRFMVIKPRVMGYADVVLQLLNGYRPDVIPDADAESDDDVFSDLFGDLSDDDWSTEEASEESNGPCSNRPIDIYSEN
jgi:hypothetical protein